jgi:mRNA-degrading endonuclease RelE of RelBE toxin-antitoxin system
MWCAPRRSNATPPGPGETADSYAFMRRVLETDAGRALYKQRQAMIEPVFAHIKHNRRATHFQRRGRSACRSEWRLARARGPGARHWLRGRLGGLWSLRVGAYGIIYRLTDADQTVRVAAIRHRSIPTGRIRGERTVEPTTR